MSSIGSVSSRSSGSSRNTTGGGAMHRPRKNARRHKSYLDKKRDARLRVNNIIGRVRAIEIMERWGSLDTGRHGIGGDES